MAILEQQLECCLMWSTMVQVLSRHQVKLLCQVAELDWPALCREIVGGQLKRARPLPAADSIPTVQPAKVADSFQQVAYLAMMSSVAFRKKEDSVLVVFRSGNTVSQIEWHYCLGSASVVSITYVLYMCLSTVSLVCIEVLKEEFSVPAAWRPVCY